MTIRLQSMYECQVKPILTSYRSRKKGSKTTVVSSPSKSLKKRVMPTRASSNASTPRKNPARSAASKNPYLGNGASSDEDGDDDRRYVTRASNNNDGPGGSGGGNSNISSRKLRARNSANTSSSTNRSSLNGHSSRNGFSPPTSSSRSTRRVKRFRISSGESLQSHQSNGRNHQTRSATAASSSTPAPRRQSQRVVEEEGSDEFEDSDEEVTMPQLHAANDSDDDFEGEGWDNETSRTSSLRRSSRVQKQATRFPRGIYDSDDNVHYGKSFMKSNKR